MRTPIRSSVVFAAAFVIPSVTFGQSSKVSLQGSATTVGSAGLSDGGRSSHLGWEAQLRVPAGPRFSIGLGYQRPTVWESEFATFGLNEIFVEPRFVLAVLGERVAIYAAGRVGVGDLECESYLDLCQGIEGSGMTVGGGGGLLLELLREFSLDIGLQLFRRSNLSGSRFIVFRAGLSVGL